jgi:Ni/Fe-hydrogenase subunit HybB-like protein
MNSRQERFVEDLLQQMPQLNSEQYRNYRRDLDDKLAHARREEKTMRWIVVCAWVAALALDVCGMLLSMRFEHLQRGRFLGWLVLPVATTVLLAPIGALLLLALYLFKYRRRLSRAHVKAQEAAIGELQRQLNELRAQLLPAQKDKPPSAPPK